GGGGGGGGEGGGGGGAGGAGGGPAPAVVRGQELGGEALGLTRIVVEPHRRVDAQREVEARAPAPRHRFLGQLAHAATFFRVQIGRDDPVAQSGEADELRVQHLAPVAGGDQHGRPARAPRQRPDRVLDQIDIVAAPRHRLPPPQHAPHPHLLLPAA